MSVLPLLTLLAASTVAHAGEEPAPAQTARAFFEAAANQNELAFAELCSPSMARTDLMLVQTLYGLLTEAPFEIDYPEPALLNGDRALAIFQMRSSIDAGNQTPPSWLWIEQDSGERWRVARIEQDLRYSREWLFETPKPGLATSPEAAAKTLFEAMEAGDRGAAERAASNLAWAGTADGLAALYQTTQDVGLRFRVAEPRVRDSRAVIPFGLDYGGEVKTDTLLFVERSGDGWIAAGFDTDGALAEQFLTGKVAGTRTHASPFDCVEGLVAAINNGQPVRLRNLCTPGFRSSHPGISGYLNLVARGGRVELPRGGLEIAGPRGVARMQVHMGGKGSTRNILWLIEDRPAGWRLIGETEVPDRASAFLEPATPR